MKHFFDILIASIHVLKQVIEDAKARIKSLTDQYEALVIIETQIFQIDRVNVSINELLSTTDRKRFLDQTEVLVDNKSIIYIQESSSNQQLNTSR